MEREKKRELERLMAERESLRIKEEQVRDEIRQLEVKGNQVQNNVRGVRTERLD